MATSCSKQRNTPCSECPWKRSSPIGHFPPERYVALAPTAQQQLGPMFACHMSKEGGEIPCAGYLMVAGPTSISVRLALAQGRLDLDSLDAQREQVYGSYAEMAVANGVPADHPSLRDPDLWVGCGEHGRIEPACEAQ